MKRVVLGFSGGVDSAVSAELLKRQGYDVFGLYLNNSGEEELLSAQKGAEFSGIPLEVTDVHRELEKKVCNEFVDAYLRGETPNPCIICNPNLKFRNILEYADKIGAEYIATGHYAKTAELPDGGRALFKGHPDNDQSYMLCRIKRSQLDRLILPLGELSKKEVREIAGQLGLPAAEKADSMEICFIPDKDYIGYIGKYRKVPEKGDVLLYGQRIGEHNGIISYTVGQRYPGLYNDKKVYVSEINAQSNSIELVYWEDLFKYEVFARNCVWLTDALEEEMEGLSVRVRHTKWENPLCSVRMQDNGRIKIVCKDSLRAPAPGQSAVLYQGERLIGSGFIEG